MSFVLQECHQRQFNCADLHVSQGTDLPNYGHAYETHAYLPIYFAVTLTMYTLIRTVYRALRKSAVSGTDHRIHTTKKTDLPRQQGFKCCMLQSSGRLMACADQQNTEVVLQA